MHDVLGKTNDLQNKKESFKNPGKKIKFYQIRDTGGKYFIQLTLEQHRG